MLAQVYKKYVLETRLRIRFRLWSQSIIQQIIDNKKYNALRFNFSSADQTLPDSKKLNTDIWYDEKTKLWLKASFDKTGFWEYRLKNYK